MFRRPLSLPVWLPAAVALLAPAARADYDYSCRCVSAGGCLYDTELLRIKTSGAEVTAQVMRYSDITLSFLIDTKYSPGRNLGFLQYAPNPDKTSTLPDGPINLWIEKPLLQGGYRLSSGAIGGFAIIPATEAGGKVSTFVCSVQ